MPQMQELVDTSQEVEEPPKNLRKKTKEGTTSSMAPGKVKACY
jgi:hypothetical protein